MEIAAAVIAFLAPCLKQAGRSLADQAGEAVNAGAAALYRLLRRKFDDEGDSFANQMLDHLEEEPDNEAWRQAAASLLDKKVQADPRFAKELQELLREADRDGEFRFAYDVDFLDVQDAEIQTADIPESARVLMQGEIRGKVIRGDRVRMQNLTIRSRPDDSA